MASGVARVPAHLEQRRIVVLTAVMSVSLILDWLFPTRYGSFTAGGVCRLARHVVDRARPDSGSTFPGKAVGKSNRELSDSPRAGLAVMASLVCLLAGRLASGQPAAGPGRGSAILALYPYEGSFDPSRARRRMSSCA